MTAPIKRMFKQFFALTLSASFLMWATLTLAQEQKIQDSKASPAASQSVNEKKVQELKEKLATKVAQLRENQKKGFYGEVSTLSKTSFTLLTANGEVKVKFNEDTLFYKTGKAKGTAASSDVKNGSFVSVLGLYDEETKQHTAKVIYVEGKLKFVSGEITEIKKDDGAFVVKTAAEGTITVDYEKTTTADELSNKKVGKSGFSRFAVGDKILIFATPADDDAKKLSAIRIMRLPKDLFAGSLKTDETKNASAAASPKSSPQASSKTTPTPSSSAKTTPRPTATPKASA